MSLADARASACPACAAAPPAAARRRRRRGRRRLMLSLPTVHCARLHRHGRAGAARRAPGVRAARVNLTLQAGRGRGRAGRRAGRALIGALERAGLRGARAGRRRARRRRATDRAGARPADAARRRRLRDDERHAAVGRGLVGRRATRRATCSTGSRPRSRCRSIAFAAQPFFRNALAALRVGRLNMDVPISLAILLAAGMSLYETAAGGAHAYFDAALSLTFFLLAGRYLDHRTRARRALGRRGTGRAGGAAGDPRRGRRARPWCRWPTWSLGDLVRVRPGGRDAGRRRGDRGRERARPLAADRREPAGRRAPRAPRSARAR